NKVLLDGMIIYNPFHSIGLFSVFDMDIIRHADVYTGGFGAQYGGRISSIMDFTSRDGNKKRFSGKVSASPFVGHALLEGPIFKAKTEEGGSGSFVLSAKTSYLPQTSKLLYTYANPNGLPFSFNDFYGKTSLSAANGSKLNLFGFHYDDHVHYQSVSDFNWVTNGIGSNFVLVPSSSPVLIQGNFAYSKYNVALTSASDNHPRSSDISGFNMGIDLTYFLNRKNSFRYGIEVVGFTTNFDFFNSVNREILQQENTTELDGFLSYKFLSKNERFVLEPSFRSQYYASLSEYSPEPRINGKFNISERIRFKFAGGLYSQNLISANSDREVVNLFYGFLAGPDNLQTQFTQQDGSVKDVTSHLQKANHTIVGFEFDLFKHIELNIEAYRKNFTQLTNLNRNKLYEDNSDPDNVSKPDNLKKDFIVETGKAEGIDLTIKYDYKHFYFWAVYSLTYVDRWDGTITYNPFFDRRHNINLVSSYTFGKNLNWEINARWNFGTGFPFTPTGGFYEKLTFNNINTNYTTANGDLSILYGNIDSKRLPAYHRFDLTIKRRFEISEHSTLEMSAGATNIYNRENIFYFDRVLYKRVNQLPILPSLSANLTF
ncbi:MAG: TonB-dependent receptor, partial [Bacteroidia bacterium]|nr:TonB-dependent receptor [Bacteroidia bacterium]